MRRAAFTLPLLLVAGALPLVSAGESCTNATLSGDYDFRISGQVFTPAGIVYRDGVAMAHFNGVDTISQVDYVLANGVPVPGPANAYGFHDHESGTYSVNPDCTGAAIIRFPTPPHGISGAVIQLALVISDNGRQIHTVVTSLTPPNSKVSVRANIHSDATKVDDN